jgi:plasmid stabilization system protein ParE
MAAETDSEVATTETQATNVEVAEPELRRPDLVWDKEAPGLCVRVYGDGAQSFLFVYRVDDRQRCLRIGTTPRWSLAAARNWAKELRAAVDQGGDPEGLNRERQKVGPVESVESVIRYIAEELGRNS